MKRRNLLTGIVTAGAAATLSASSQQSTPGAASGPYIERPAEGQPHKGKVLLAIQAHNDDISLSSAGTVAKLVEEGYTGYMVRATNDDMGDAFGLGTMGTIGENVLGNEKDMQRITDILGCKKLYNLNYNNHRMGGAALNEVICRMILIIRITKADTVMCWDPWAHDEENPDHYTIARAVEAACWMAGRAHDYPEQFDAGLQPHTVTDKYYFARRPEITRVVDVSKQVDKKIEAMRANVWKGPAGDHGSRLKAELAKKNMRLPLLDGDDETANRNYIRQFSMTRSRQLGQRYGLEYAEVFHYVGPNASGGERGNTVDNYVKQHAVPL
jgi:LmbE family N-acetylglucosaminyl deacetylase